jgi:serine/threonine protein kinase
MAMEFVPGKTVEALLKQNGRLSVEHASQVASHVLHALDYAHRHGVVHRDIKAANIIVTPGGNVKVMDFGIARVLGTERRTRVGFVVGTIGYMAPEQIQGLDVDGRTDIYAVGVVLYEMLTGRMPFQGETEYAVMQAQVQQMPVPPGAYANIPAAVEACVMRALAKQPAERYQTAAEFNGMLQAALRVGPGAPAGSGTFARPADETREFKSDPMLQAPPAGVSPTLGPPASGSGVKTPPPGAATPSPPTYTPPPATPVPSPPTYTPPSATPTPSRPAYTPAPFTTYSPPPTPAIGTPPAGGVPGAAAPVAGAGASGPVPVLGDPVRIPPPPIATSPPPPPSGAFAPPPRATPPVPPLPPPVESSPSVPAPTAWPAVPSAPTPRAVSAVPAPKTSAGVPPALVALLGVLALAAVGGGAYLGWQWWQARQATAAQPPEADVAGETAQPDAQPPVDGTPVADAGVSPPTGGPVAASGPPAGGAVDAPREAATGASAPVTPSPPAAPRPRRAPAPPSEQPSAVPEAQAEPLVVDPRPAPVAPEPAPLRPVLPPATFGSVKWMRVEGSRIREVDVFMQVTDEEIRLFDRRSRAMVASAAYPQISSALYSQGKRPRWRVDLGPAPAATAFDDTVRTFHYVAFQGPSQFLLTRIDRGDLARLREELQKRSSIALDLDR